MKVINHENIKETINKQPIICFYSSNGACGASGLFFVVFDDKSIYAYSTYYENYDETIIKDIIEYIPESKALLFYDGDYNPKRKSFISDMEDFNLGLGNDALIDELFTYFNYTYRISEFYDFVEEFTKVSVGEIFDEVKSVLG